MIKGCKICGIKDLNILNFLINHPYPPKFIGFICNYPKSSRYVKSDDLKKLINIHKNKSEFVAVLVKPKNAFENKVSGIVIGRSLTKGNIKNNTKKLLDHLGK